MVEIICAIIVILLVCVALIMVRSRSLVRRSRGTVGRYGTTRGHLVRGAMHLARRAAPYVAKAYNSWKNSAGDKESKSARLSNPVHGVSSGFAEGHNAYVKHSKHSRLSKKKFKRKVRWETKVRSAVQGVTKFQEYIQNTILMAPVPVDNQAWFEIPIMCGAQYAAAGTFTDANNVYYQTIADPGDYRGAADVAINANATLTNNTNAGTVGTALAYNSQFGANGKFLVYGYCVQYQIQNIQSFPIEVVVFEVDCIKDMANVSNSMFSTATCYAASGSTSVLALSQVASLSRFLELQESGNESSSSYLNWGATPMLYSDPGAYLNIRRSHVHVLDPAQVIRLEKKYTFKRPIRFQDMNGVLFKKGVSHVLAGCVRSAVIGSGSGGGYQGAALGGVAVGNGGFTHSCAITYQKRFVIKPLTQGNNQMGMGSVYT